MELATGQQSRPRNVDWKRAAALLYGDWGTSKTYVTGIAFSIAMFSSFWFVLAVGALTALVGINYVWVCKYFPQGGGVYSAARAHSRHLALVGGFLLVANYLVTAALSCFEAFVYFNFQFEDAKRWAIVAIFLIGVMNFFGPKHSGSLAMWLAVGTVVVIGLLALAAIPHIPDAIAKVERPSREPLQWWVAFTGVILALSGVESIANMTGVMKLDPGATPSSPSVTRTARKAILPVLIEVVVLTTFFGLVMNALPDLYSVDARGQTVTTHDGDMLRHMGEVFVDQKVEQVPGLGWLAGKNLFSWLVSLVIGGLLLSATNTAIVALVSVLYLMTKDGDLPQPFGALNRFGVPWIHMLIAILGCILLLDIQSGKEALHHLAGLYAIGVVGAIAVNLGSCVFNFKLPMLRHERIVMSVTFLIVAAIEITIAVTNLWALLFVAIVIGSGFLARAMHKGFDFPIPKRAGRLAEAFFPALVARQRQEQATKDGGQTFADQLGRARPITAILVAARGVTPTLRYAVEEARKHGAELFVLFIREIFTTIPTAQSGEDDREAQEVFNAAQSVAEGVKVTPIYAVSDDASWTILDNAAIAGVDLLILGQSRRGALTRMLRGNLMHQLATNLPEEIRLMIVS